ncbi:MAG: hypothetical protein HZC55_08565 [Verrucomicrobia bacterium]|nr:hypothetical protein [Verrucomicrobiota bacterium]
MIRGVEPVGGALLAGASLWLGLLWLGSRVGLSQRRRSVQGAAALLAVGALFVPLGEMPLWQWVFSFCPNPSVPAIAVVGAALWERLRGVPVVRVAEWRLLWGFGAVAGTLLYLHPLLPSSVDPYYFGWRHAPAIWAMAGLALLAFGAGNRAGSVFFVALVAYELRVLESPNAWDYVVDPLFWLWSLGKGAAAGLRVGLRWWRRTRFSRPPFPSAVPGPAAGG